MRGSLRLTLATVVALAGLVVPIGISTSRAIAAALPAVPIYYGPAGDGSPAIRPARIEYTGDGSGFYGGPGRPGKSSNAGRLRWSEWTREQARATGDDWLDNCTPDCASGKFTPFPITLKLSRPRHLDGFYVFTRITLTYTGKLAPGMRTRVATIPIRYEPGGGGFVF